MSSVPRYQEEDVPRALQPRPSDLSMYPSAHEHMYDPSVLWHCWLHVLSSLHSSKSANANKIPPIEINLQLFTVSATYQHVTALYVVLILCLHWSNQISILYCDDRLSSRWHHCRSQLP